MSWVHEAACGCVVVEGGKCGTPYGHVGGTDRSIPDYSLDRPCRLVGVWLESISACPEHVIPHFHMGAISAHVDPLALEGIEA